MLGRAGMLLSFLLLAACPDERDGPQRCKDSSECPEVDCGSMTLQYCHENYCETDPEVACDVATTASSSAGAGGN